MKQAAYGTPHGVMWGTNAKNTIRVLQFMPDFGLNQNIPGRQKSLFPTTSEEDAGTGFKYIREEWGGQEEPKADVLDPKNHCR